MKDKLPLALLLVAVIIAFIFAGKGWSMHKKVAEQETAFQKLQAEYYINSKEVRDSAATGSELNRQLIEIQNYPSQIMGLQLLGIGKILSGVFFVGLGILIVLIMMPIRAAEEIKRKMMPNTTPPAKKEEQTTL